MTAEFNELGLRFLYPENWKLVREDQRGGPRSISVHSPQGAFWAVTVDQWPADDLVDRVVELIRQEYEDVEVEPIERSVGPTDAARRRIAILLSRSAGHRPGVGVSRACSSRWSCCCRARTETSTSWCASSTPSV